MDEQLNALLREAILAAQARREDPITAAEKAAQAFKAGLGAFRNPVTRPAAGPAGRPSDQ
jgi:hypothetical protein